MITFDAKHKKAAVSDAKLAAALAGSANFEDILYHRIERSCPNTSKHGFCKEVDTQFYLSAFSPILFIGADEPAVWFQDCW
mgnify:CR=1 FL=1